MKPTSIFQFVVLAVFVIFILIGVVAFATYKGNNPTELPEMVMWGSVDKQIVEEVVSNIDLRGSGLRVTYVFKPSETFERDFLDALASGSGPDLVIFPHDLLVRHQNKLLTIPSASFSERDFKDQFVGAGEIFLIPEGSKGLPLLVDPLVMYWNRTLLSGAGISNPPRYWDELFTLAPQINQRDSSGAFTKTLVPLGEYSNVSNAKALIASLILQGNNAIVGRNSQGVLTALLALRGVNELSPVESAVRFYTDFSNSSKAHYSWNRGLPLSKDLFISGKLGLYFGFASELSQLRAKNPNLDMDVAPLPQAREAGRVATYANVYAVSIPRSVSNPQAALASAVLLSGKLGAQIFADKLNLPPVRRDLLSNLPKDPYREIFYKASLQSYSWLDPSSTETDGIFSRMINSVTSGKSRIGEAVDRAQTELQSLIFSVSSN